MRRPRVAVSDVAIDNVCGARLRMSRITDLGGGRWGPAPIRVRRLGSGFYTRLALGVRLPYASGSWGPGRKRGNGDNCSLMSTKHGPQPRNAHEARTPASGHVRGADPSAGTRTKHGPQPRNARETRTPASGHVQGTDPSAGLRTKHDPHAEKRSAGRSSRLLGLVDVPLGGLPPFHARQVRGTGHPGSPGG